MKENIIDKLKNINEQYKYELSLNTFGELLTLYNSGLLNFDHDTQRKKIWDIGKATKFIESVLLGFPFQPIYISENEKFYSVIDGKQRLITMIKFLGSFVENENSEVSLGDKTNIVNKFELDIDFLSPKIINLLDIQPNDKLDYKFLCNKYEDFNNLYATIIFPTYSCDNTNFKDGDEKGVYDVFARLNSTGVPIESGDIYKSKIFSDLEKIEEKTNLKKTVKKFKNSIIGTKKEILLNDKEWFLFFKVIWVFLNYNDFLNFNYNIKNIEEDIDNMLQEKNIENIKNAIMLIDDVSKHILDLKKNWNKEDEKVKSLFNRKLNNSQPLNFWLNIYPVLMKLKSEQKTLPNLSKFKDIIKLINNIYDGNEPFVISEEGVETKKLKSKFTREPEKISLLIFCIDEFLIKNIGDYEKISNNIKTKLLQKNS
ncbi:DUF262 domain-containing protein [Spiroplasma turonicum]|uniref:GmrSD restriction endonucleases N-terminal domain-containing protein n=1 Tax=Spiroplasma turonicum TaxID=216946 RepID=A0A0K1P7D0_9MOLU|nr:DUF262 domain-containing protein [Spiroplasma turonicum]AKU79812.1 hypothetical protein STURON_00566 [Spiroplasma turonicum]ALX70830.1 hypothetical protein STURO_v1c05640 [Spiroplasma turonicum]